jgi:tRNA-dihydrouridine synthase
MLPTTEIRGIALRPALVCAPLAGVTNCAFRRLVAEFGGCGAYYTEMLSARQILCEDLVRSPSLRRSSREERVIYQLLAGAGDPLDRIIDRLSEIKPDGLDLNLACDSPNIRKFFGGIRLFEHLPALEAVLRSIRACWPGLFTVKIRLGREVPDWQDRLAERLRLFADCGVDAVVLHPRFVEERLRRRARHELLEWAAGVSRLPLIANGDIAGAASVRADPHLARHPGALMVGRMAAAQPWVFAGWERPVAVDHAEVWRRLDAYTREAFPPLKAIARIKVFTQYYARNFQFGHCLYVAVQNAPTLEAVRERAEAFFATAPAIDPAPSLLGL